MTVICTLYLYRIGQISEIYTFLYCMMYFFGSCRYFSR